MTQRPPDLPDFENPPLVEVVLSVQFSELRDYRSVHAGLLWERIFRRSYPKFHDRSPLNASFETFGTVPPGEAKFEITRIPGPPVPRVWFVNAAETELVQVQSDRFVHNWRKATDHGDYPRYETIKHNFFDELRKLDKFFKQENIGQIEPNQCEVTYVNHIVLANNASIWTDPHAALCVVSKVAHESSDPAARLPRMEDAGYSARFIIDNLEGIPMARLIVSAQPVVGADHRPVLRLDLTVRGAPTEPTFDAVSGFFDLGRETIVRGFAALTTPAMHKQWGRLK